MAEINAAFQVLGDPPFKRRYDDRLIQDSAPAQQSGASACGTPGPRQGIGDAGARIAILFITALMALTYGVGMKSWWQWTWELLAPGFEPPSLYVLHWPLLVVTLSLGVWLASGVGREPR